MSQNNTEKNSTFDKFTNQYSLSKTLRFELRPVGNTEQFLKDSGIIQADEKRKKSYEKTKPFFNRLHQEFINESLSGVALNSLNGYDMVYKDWKTDHKNKENTKKLEKKEKEIREEIVSLFDKKATEWISNLQEDVKVKKDNHEFLFEPSVFSVLKKKYGDAPDTIISGQSIFDSWDKWSAYFNKFFETRKNFYKSDGTATAVATRIVNDNLRRFCDNIEIFNTLKGRLDLSNLVKDINTPLDDFFSLEHYNLYLNQDGIDTFNMVIGGAKDQKYKGINQYINEHKQKTGEKLSRLKKLDKQIGSDKQNFLDLIENDEQLKEQLAIFVSDAKEKFGIFNKCLTYLFEGQGNLNHIYFRKEAINTITRRWFLSYQSISSALIDTLRVAGNKDVKFDQKSEMYKFPDFTSWHDIKIAIEKLGENKENIWKDYYHENIPGLKNIDPWGQFLAIFKFECDNLKFGDNKGQENDLTYLIEKIELLLTSDCFKSNNTTINIIKSFADRVLNIYRFAKYFAIDKSRQWNPDGLNLDDFYIDYEQFYSDGYEKIVKIYDKIRNYVTKKPFSQKKWVLNFENPTLANGFDKNKETDNTAIILRKNGRYYLGIMNKDNNTVFKNPPKSLSGYEKMVYKLFPDPAKMMPKVCFSEKGLKFFNPSDKIVKIYKNGEFKKGDTFSLSSMHSLIDFYKTALDKYAGWSMYNFKHIRRTGSYTKNIGEFYRDVAQDGYKIDFDLISDNYIIQLNKEGKLYLFEIHNKDWNLKDGVEKKGAKNAHTIYFEQVFSEENAHNNFVVKLNGEAELFFRPATNEEKLGKHYDKRGNLVVKNKRYSKDKIYFHVPTTLNRTASDSRSFNQAINKFLANNPNINIIGIDRGEKHLAYLSVINQKGEILEIKSLNKINGVDYASLLERRAIEREEARRDWKSVEQIKDLKKGYISNVVREIADLVIKYNAIVVFEDLNMRFKQVRGGIEKSVYQQLEKALIDKFNFLVNKKEIDPERAGHVLRAYQLTAPFETFKNIGKQTGILFYTQAEYTSQTDPVTGFRKNVYISNSETVNKVKDAIYKFDKIGWDEKLKSYYFDYNPVNFVSEKFKDGVISKTWRVYVNVPRIKREKLQGYWETVSVNPNDKFKELFELWNFDLTEQDIKDQIVKMDQEKKLDGTKEFDGKKRNFWNSFISLFNLVLQVRNSTSTQYKKDDEGNIQEIIEGVDFIASPVEPFFCTDGGKYTKGFVKLTDLENKFIGNTKSKDQFIKEFNGDANGAYNIARKGIMILSNLSKNPGKPELFLSRKDWDIFAQQK